MMDAEVQRDPTNQPLLQIAANPDAQYNVMAKVLAAAKNAQMLKIGFVQQSPENQVVTDKVWHELAFGLESLGFDTPTIRRRVAEMASFFGIQDWFYKNVTELSGGQKQRAAAARALITEPRLLLADEPTGALDSKAADELLQLFNAVNQEGQTILMVTHSTKAASHAKRVLYIKDGEVFHQLYRGNMNNEELYAKISDTLTMLTTGGEQNE